jgi:uncharacterized repeat protein (TIGR01451 family)
MKATKIGALLLVPVLLASFLLTTGLVLAVGDLGLFELDRNATDTAGDGDDWATLYAGGGSAVEFTGVIADLMEPNPLGTMGTQFQAGGSKDDLDISPGGATGQHWKWDDGEPLDKDDITNAYAAAYVNTVDTGENNIGDLIIYFGLDRYANNGSAQVGFWFLQDPNFGLTTTPDGGGYLFSGHHEIGDVLVQSNFSRGGVIDSISVFEWVGSGGSDDTLDLVFSAQDCLTPGLTDDPACATVNQGDTPSPWPYTPKSGTDGIFPQGSFFEGGINITRLVPDAGCFTGFLAETRSSTPFDSRLKDFALGNFELCSIAVTKDGDTLSKIGDDVDYTITVENTGALTLYKQSIEDSLLGDLTGEADCGASLAPGESCTINVSRTVLSTDPDPLDNTVTVVYDSSSDLLGDEVSGSDDHSVNLFQPTITFDKSADSTLSKEGDTVNYTLTLDNTSSDDTPNLTCTVTDPLLGVDETVNLASGGQHVINQAKVMPAAPDPFVNTASVSCQVDGFSNVLTASDSWTVNLFQPSITFDKSADATLSKEGDTVNYTLTLDNTSSGDSPDLTCTISDPVLGVDETVSLASGGQHVINQAQVMPAAPDPFVNTASVSCQVDGFSNVLTESDSWTVNLFQPSITFDKSADATLSKEGDTVNYTLTLDNTSSGDSPNLTCTISDPVLGVDETVNLASGGQHVIDQAQVMPAAPDPFVNTASVSCQVDGFSNVLTESDSWTVNLFQPSVTIDKTGDDLSKVGDPVDYVITVTNTSSGDSPNLTCTISDPLLGINKVVNLASGGVDVTNATRDVQAGDPDPLTNTASVTCNVDGFPNVLGPVSDSHTTELFQPGVEVIKTGPDTAARGETITYFYTINNLSSADGPDLILDSVVDDKIGDLTAAAAAAGCGTLGFGGTCDFSADYTIALDDPNPVVNIVTVHYHPDGFPNDITDDDEHRVSIPILGCTPGFWQGGAGAPLWNEPSVFDGGSGDPDWPGVLPQPFSHATLFNDYFNSGPIDPRLDGQTMLQIVSNDGGSANAAEKAARDMVAAYLNESAFPEDFPADSLAQLEADWYAAVAGGDDGLNAFHVLVAGWNQPEPPGYCPLGGTGSFLATR